MKSLKEYLIEGVFNDSTDNVQGFYPKNTRELIFFIKKIIDAHKNDKIIDLNDIDTSQITDMSYLFNNPYCAKYNFDVSDWDVSKVKYMTSMFDLCKNFNCDLSKWDVSNVEDMSYMFKNCKNFNCDLSKWDVGNVEQMSYMFDGCENFNCDLSKWDVRKVEYIVDAFKNCKNFNCDLSKWDLKDAKTSDDLFYGCPMEDHPELQPKNIDCY